MSWLLLREDEVSAAVGIILCLVNSLLIVLDISLGQSLRFLQVDVSLSYDLVVYGCEQLFTVSRGHFSDVLLQLLLLLLARQEILHLVEPSRIEFFVGEFHFLHAVFGRIELLVVLGPEGLSLYVFDVRPRNATLIFPLKPDVCWNLRA